jgi:hypothetical protein
MIKDRSGSSPSPTRLLPLFFLSSPRSGLAHGWQRVARIVLMIVVVAALLLAMSCVVFTYRCVHSGHCGLLQEPRGFIALASAYSGHRPGKAPAEAKCSCHGQCDVEVELSGPELTPEQIRDLVPTNAVNPPFVSKAQHFPASVYLEANWRDIQREARCLVKQGDAIPQFHQIDSAQTRLATKVRHVEGQECRYKVEMTHHRKCAPWKSEEYAVLMDANHFPNLGRCGSCRILHPGTRLSSRCMASGLKKTPAWCRVPPS